MDSQARREGDVLPRICLEDLTIPAMRRPGGGTQIPDRERMRDYFSDWLVDVVIALPFQMALRYFCTGCYSNAPPADAECRRQRYGLTAVAAFNGGVPGQCEICDILG